MFGGTQGRGGHTHCYQDITYFANFKIRGNISLAHRFTYPKLAFGVPFEDKVWILNLHTVLVELACILPQTLPYPG